MGRTAISMTEWVFTSPSMDSRQLLPIQVKVTDAQFLMAYWAHSFKA